MEKEYCIITTACNKKEIADKIIETLLEKRLVCCCQVININSSYWWKGKIEREPEFFIQKKTKKTLFKEVEKEILKISLIENLQREDLNPIEEAQAYQKLQEDYGLKQDEIAASVSKSRTAITNTMRLLKLDERVQKMVMDNLISSGHGRTIIPIEDKELQYETACKILDENLSVREAEQLVKKLLERKPDKEKKEEESQQNAEMFHYFEGRMKDILGSKVTIKNKKNNKGRIEIEYYSAEELERIIDLIQSIQ